MSKKIQFFIKRIFDIVISFIGLIVLFPIILLVALLIRINLGSPVIFKQERPGYKQKSFFVYKFRTMNNKKDEIGNLLPDSERLTSFGKIIRKLSLDELPQLINVLKGDMSLVGPRPLLVRYLPYYKERELIRFNVKPGITGLAQINGRNTVSWDERFKYDIYYVENYNLFLDIKILFLTFSKVFKSDGVISAPNTLMKSLDREREGVISE
ncbi:sugar transferase [Clostridium perfringens]|uniref:Sugar transferase n=1 Tax=Clostridium perfringens TaxID=1502 RepID=A0A6G4ZEK6_CLOPF|nr:sugar transferase [Clostridium perfringens]EGT0682812.1 sugar transferase [Clostridium perfringens]EGT0686541.1 sugar transferase [Clostridium perfringens]EHK2279534.1 sugar transferase [Clostridium perfringens]ELC8393119.1 sugar transferase [Clostridium perfringens]ELC8394159.1 sugar transferase [Clostridium perfringens]